MYDLFLYIGKGMLKLAANEKELQEKQKAVLSGASSSANPADNKVDICIIL